MSKNAPRRALAGVAASSLLACGPAFAQQAVPAPEPPAVIAAEPAAAPRRVRVALVNLKDAAAIGAIASSEPVKSTWRHTFGAERKTVAVADRLDPMAWAADIVLVQGFTSLRETRKLFPARGWKLVMSRQLVDAQTSVTLAQRPPATAIAVRHRLGLRIAGQELKLDAATGTAVRVLVSGSPVWFLSASPSSGEGAAAIETWLAAKLTAGEQTVIGGRLPPSVPADRGAAVPQAVKPGVPGAAAPAAMPALLSKGERRLVDGAGKGYARFPAANPPSPCGGTAAGADTIVVDQRVADRMKPDTGGWLVVMRKPAPPQLPATATAPPLPAQPPPQIKAGVPPPKQPAATAAAPAAPVPPEPAACVLLLDLGV